MATSTHTGCSGPSDSARGAGAGGDRRAGREALDAVTVVRADTGEVVVRPSPDAQVTVLGVHETVDRPAVDDDTAADPVPIVKYTVTAQPCAAPQRVSASAAPLTSLSNPIGHVEPLGEVSADIGVVPAAASVSS